MTDLADLVTELESSSWALAALCCAFETGLAEHLKRRVSLEELVSRVAIPPELVEPLLDVLVSQRLVRREGSYFEADDAFRPYLLSPVKDFFQSRLSAHNYQIVRLVQVVRNRESPGAGWSHTDLDYLHDIGILSATFAKVLAKEVFPRMEGMEARLAATPRFLEVGTGVAAFTIQMCRLWPKMRVVGLEVLEPSFESAVENIDDAGLSERVELRHQSVTELSEKELYDVAWLPLSFFKRELIEVAIQKVFTALQPGGWVVASTVSIPGSDLKAAVSRLVGPLWGGHGIHAEDVAFLLEKNGYQQVKRIPMAPGVQPIIVGRRPV